MKSVLFEHYKKKYASGGKKLPVRKTGMWYQEGDVVVPSNEITMKGPEGEKDYFDSPIMGIGLQSGESQVMLPGEDYFFPKDEAVLEKKMQKGAKVGNKEMTPEQQARFNAYMKTERPRDIEMPEWLSLSSGATNYARALNRMPMEQFVNMPGDISKNVTNAFNRGVSYSIDAEMPRGLGQIETDGTYTPFGQNTLEDMYSGLVYRKSFPKGSVRVSPEEQSFELRGKQGNIKYKRQGSDEEKISELAFNLNMRPNMTLYGKGMMGNTEVNVDPRFINFSNYKQGQIDPQYRVSGGLRGNAGPLNYDLSGNYNPDTGYAYQGSADLSLLKNRLNLSGRVSGNQEDGLNSYSAEARARLAKGLNLTASYGKSNQDAARYNIGLTYNKAFEEGGEVEEDDDEEMVEGIADILRRVKDKKNRKQIAKKMVEDFEEEEVEYNLDDFMQAAKLMQMGGMSIPGINGVVVGSAPMSLQSQYKNKRKK
jgi:hypothetical protein